MADADHSLESATAAADPEASGRGHMTGLKFRWLVVQHHRVAYGLARSLLKDAHEAEDVVQEAFERLWRQGSKVEKPKEWLMAVTRNACLDRLRRTARNVGEAEAPEPREERDPSWHFDQAALGRALRAAIDSLPEPQRSLVVMFDVQGLSGAECARVLELSAEQVKVYLHRARRRLRTKLEHRQ